MWAKPLSSPLLTLPALACVCHGGSSTCLRERGPASFLLWLTVAPWLAGAPAWSHFPTPAPSLVGLTGHVGAAPRLGGEAIRPRQDPHGEAPDVAAGPLLVHLPWPLPSIHFLLGLDSALGGPVSQVVDHEMSLGDGVGAAHRIMGFTGFSQVERKKTESQVGRRPHQVAHALSREPALSPWRTLHPAPDWAYWTWVFWGSSVSSLPSIQVFQPRACCKLDSPPQVWLRTLPPTPVSHPAPPVVMHPRPSPGGEPRTALLTCSRGASQTCLFGRGLHPDPVPWAVHIHSPDLPGEDPGSHGPQGLGPLLLSTWPVPLALKGRLFLVLFWTLVPSLSMSQFPWGHLSARLPASPS